MSEEDKDDANVTGHPTDGQPGIEFDEFWEAEFLRTGNPVYVWYAINQLSVYGSMWAAHHGVPASPPRAIPAWCIRYLVDVASRICDLSRGLDETLRPKESDELSAWAAWGRNPTLTPKKAARRVSKALRLDWRAFTNFRHTERAALAEHIYRQKRSDGLSARQAADLAMRELEIEDERTLRRYFAEARQRWAKPPG